jgi:hypothetical protein
MLFKLQPELDRLAEVSLALGPTRPAFDPRRAFVNGLLTMPGALEPG